jgi:hypothetical protein
MKPETKPTGGEITRREMIASLGAMTAALPALLAAGPQTGRAATRPASSAEPGGPLYLLTYDHGGLILWGSEHFAERLRNAISWLDRYPGFKIGLDNEAHVYDRLAAEDPKLLEELRGYLAKYAGRFGIGTCTYGQPLSTFINEESNIRQIAYAIRADQKHLGYTPTIYLMSEHAMHAQIPQILAAFGFKGAIMRTHFMMYGYNPTFDVPIGLWAGLDGSRIPTVPTYPGEGAEFGKTPLDNWFLTRYPGSEVTVSPEDYRKKFAHIRPLLATRADDSGLRKEALVKQYDGNPEYRWILLDELLSIFPAPTAEMKTLPNDFVVRMPWGYCGNEIWNRSREAEVAVLTAERLAAMELWLGGANHEAEIDEAWKYLLVGQHHDIQICGLLPEARKFLPASIAASTKVRDASMAYIASRMKGEGLGQVTVFNALSWPRREWVETNVSLKQGQAKALVVKCGPAVSFACFTGSRYADGSIREGRVAFAADIGGLSFATYSLLPPPEDEDFITPSTRVDVNALSMSTPLLEAKLHPDGGIASLSDRRSGRSLLDPAKRSAFFTGTIDGKDLESRGTWTIEPPDTGVPLTATEKGLIGNIPYTFQITFHNDSTQLDCRVQFHFDGQKIGRVSDQTRDSVSPFVHEQKLRFKVFPGLAATATGVRDLPFAVAETNNRYVEGNYWTALADGQHGFAFFNRGTMGAVREADGGFSLPLAYSMYYIWGTRMLSGDFSYEFALYPFAGEWRKADLHRLALAYNFPPVVTSGQAGTGELGDVFQPLEIASDNVILSALHSQNGKFYARLYEHTGAAGAAAITTPRRQAQLSDADPLGHVSNRVTSPVAFQPWQFRTLRIDPGA